MFALAGLCEANGGLLLYMLGLGVLGPTSTLMASGRSASGSAVTIQRW